MVTLPFSRTRRLAVAEPQPLRVGDSGAGPNDVPPLPENSGKFRKTAGVASLLPVNLAPRKPRAAATWTAGSPPGERQLGELFYVTMISPIRQGMRLTAVNSTYRCPVDFKGYRHTMQSSLGRIGQRWGATRTPLGQPGKGRRRDVSASPFSAASLGRNHESHFRIKLLLFCC